jgi:hypothetical protein
MGCLGRHIALTPEQAKHLRAIYNYEVELEEDMDCEEAMWEALQEIENKLPSKYYHDTDKAWDPIHRALTLDNTPGGRLCGSAGERPLNLCICGGDDLCDESENFCICLIEPDEVAVLASALAEVEEGWLRKRFFTLDPKACLYDIDEDEWGYTWSNFCGLPAFFARAAAEGRPVVFSVAF